jgi:hypothetical protein
MTAALLLVLIAAPPQSAPQVPAEAATGAVLRVEGGYASAELVPPGEPVYVWARFQPDRQVFLGWEGDGVRWLADPLSWSTSLTVTDAAPAGEIRVRARFAAAAPPQVQTLGFPAPAGAAAAGAENAAAAEKLLDYALPAAPARGLVFLFHDSDARRAFWRKGEGLFLATQLLHAGFAVAALNSDETERKDPGTDGLFRWQGSNLDVAANVDAQNLLAARAALAAKNLVSADAPCFGVGLGNGGTFAISAAAMLDWQAAAAIGGPGRKAVLQDHDVPTIWIVANKDMAIRGVVDDAQANHDLLKGRGVPTDLVLRRSSPLRVERLMDRCGMDPQVAEDLIATMKRTGLLNAEGVPLHPAGIILARTESEKNNYADLHLWIDEDMGLRLPAFEDQIKACWADHVLTADDALRLVRFFEARLDAR